MASVSVNADINEIYGWVRDQLTKEPLIGTQVSLYSDTTLVTKYTVTNDMTFAGSRAPYLLEVSKEGGSYKMKFVKEGYEDLTEDITIKPFKKGESFKYLKDFVMKRKPKEYKVGEAVVTATKVKIYHKGDTLVYNADAFQLAEGSMLDGLIKSLPNAELKDNGEIFVNSATAIAHSMGVSDKFIAVTVLAGGTSLPELATSIVAAAKHKDELALGNILGSNVFNILLILGCSAVVTPLSFSGMNLVDAAALILSTLMLLLWAYTGKRCRIDRWEGAVMLLAFAAYYYYLFTKL